MPKGYWIANIDVTDADAYKAYVAANAEAFSKFGARFLVRAGNHEVREGTGRSRQVILEFPSFQAARDCYASEEYARAKALRVSASEGDLIVLEGYDGPQPGE